MKQLQRIKKNHENRALCIHLLWSCFLEFKQNFFTLQGLNSSNLPEYINNVMFDYVKSIICIAKDRAILINK